MRRGLPEATHPFQEVGIAVRILNPAHEWVFIVVAAPADWTGRDVIAAPRDIGGHNLSRLRVPIGRIYRVNLLHEEWLIGRMHRARPIGERATNHKLTTPRVFRLGYRLPV